MKFFIIYFSGLFPYMDVIIKSTEKVKRKIEIEHTIEKNTTELHSYHKSRAEKWLILQLRKHKNVSQWFSTESVIDWLLIIYI